MNLETLNLIAPATFVGVIMTLTLVPLGRVVLQRGIIFIDLAVAQVASLGLVLATFLHVHETYTIQFLALTMALSSALLFTLIEQKHSGYLEAFIGIVYVFSATLALLMLSYHPQGAEHFESLLSGELLFVTWDKLLFHLPVYLFVILLWMLVPSVRKGLTFYLMFALTITSAVQLVGVFMLFTLLIAPALMMAITRIKLFTTYGITISAFALGILVSLLTDAPTSACIILAIISLCLLKVIFAKNTS